MHRRRPAVFGAGDWLAAWGTQRAGKVFVGVFDKLPASYGVQRVALAAAAPPYQPMDEGTYPGDMLRLGCSDLEILALPMLRTWIDDPPREIRARRQISVLCAYLAMSHARLPSLHDQALEYGVARRGLSPFGTASDPPRSRREGGETRSLDDIRRTLGEDDVHVEMKPHEAARLDLHVPEAAFGAFLAMRWSLVGAPPDTEFVTADASVNVFVHDEVRAARGRIPIPPRADVSFPLSPRVCLLGRGGSPRSADPTADELNLRQVSGAERYVYFRKRTPKVEEAIATAADLRSTAEYDLSFGGDFGALVVRGRHAVPHRGERIACDDLPSVNEPGAFRSAPSPG